MLRTDGWTDGQSGPTTRPAFAKATQVTIILLRKREQFDTVSWVSQWYMIVAFSDHTFLLFYSIQYFGPLKIAKTHLPSGLLSY